MPLWFTEWHDVCSTLPKTDPNVLIQGTGGLFSTRNLTLCVTSPTRTGTHCPHFTRAILSLTG